MSRVSFTLQEDDLRSHRWAQGVVLQRKYADLACKGCEVTLDLARVDFLDPLALIRIRGFLDWWLEQGVSVHIQPPKSKQIANYLSRMM